MIIQKYIASNYSGWVVDGKVMIIHKTLDQKEDDFSVILILNNYSKDFFKSKLELQIEIIKKIIK